MRVTLLSVAVLAAGTMLAASPAAAQTYGGGYPVCLRVYGPESHFDCSYTSIAQCNATASGRDAQCEVNPFQANANAGMDSPPGGVRRPRRANH